MTNSAGGFIKAIESGSKHLLIKRFTLRYPEKKLKFVGDGYQFDPKRGVGIAGSRGRHILFHDKCTGCQLCAIACEGIAEAIGMVKVNEQWKHNKKSIMPQIDYGKCVFCGLCVDACPFYALYMTNDYELSSFTKEHLIYTPSQLGIKPKYDGDVELKIDTGDVVHVVSDDTSADLEMIRWSEEKGQGLLEFRKEGNLFHFIVKKLK